MAQEGAIDSDGDNVADHVDVCPQTPGSPSNSGCPIGEEIVFAYGTNLSNVYSVTCPDGSVEIFWDSCLGYGSWGTFRTGLYKDDHSSNLTGAYGGDDGYRPPPPEPDPDSGEVSVQTDDGTDWTCYGVATGVTVAGSTLVAAGFVVGVIAVSPPPLLRSRVPYMTNPASPTTT